ncbi:hypothetical protein LEN26_020254 [Aphanomyces euteiches]|nr:hypothetical protein LEN26_020254 [Aphanomyces euteiches]KAH9101759.1 hypothetical protein AeMF1_021464 [Aphanomyces euteiches]KAH9195345.1 hypothetical protein AeNC1_002678 [Aphanomyces euteiches]
MSTKHAHPGVPVVAGAIAGGIEMCSIWPMEMIKTNLQLGTMKSHYNGMLAGFRYHIATDGVLSLYRGLAPVLVGSLPKAGLRFGAFDYIKRLLADKDGKSSTMRNLAAGLSAGALEAVLVTTPTETIKTKLIDSNSGMVRGIQNIVRTQGIGGLYQGLSATVLKQASNTGLRFMWFTEYKARVPGLLERQGIAYSQLSEGQHALVSFVGGMTAGIFSTFGNNPFDVMKTKMQGLEGKRYANTWDCATTIFRRDGFKGFYSGVVPRLGRVIPGQGIIFMSYDTISRVVSKYFDDNEISVSIAVKSNA